MVDASTREIVSRARTHSTPTIYVMIRPRHPFLAVKKAGGFLTLDSRKAIKERLETH
jgi:hypothetical protein